MALSRTRTLPVLFDEQVPRKHLLGQAAVFAIWIGTTAIGAFLHPSAAGHGTHEQLGLPACPSVLLFDRPCPGCGLTTSWTATIHGNIPFALHAHPLGPLLYLLFTCLALLGGYGYITGRRLRTYSEPFNRASAIIAAVFICFGLIRFAMTPHFAARYEREAYGFTSNR